MSIDTPEAHLSVDASQTRNYDELQAVLSYTELSVSPSELQGFTVAMLAYPKKIDPLFWFDQCVELYSNSKLEQINPEDKAFLVSFLQVTESDLLQASLSFDVILPDESFTLSQRTAELSNWCQGFLLGVGLYINKESLATHPELENLLSDIEKISNVEIPNDEALQNEEVQALEFDLFELSEYLKIAALSLHTEFLFSEEDKKALEPQLDMQH